MHNKKHSFFSHKTQKEKENIALLVGLTLIVFVIVFTLLRNNIFSSKKNPDQVADSISRDTNLPNYATISPSELNKKIITSTNKDEITLLDIRPFEAYIAEHMLDSINIPINEFPIASKINAHSLIVIIAKDNTDKDITTAIDSLKNEDYSNIMVLAGGITAWKQLIGETVTYGDPKSFVDQAKVSYLNPEELNDAIAKNVPLYILDIRSNDEYKKGHITGAVNIPLEELEQRRLEIKEKRIVVVGANEIEEFQASVQLYDMLLASPFVMRTAMPGWLNKGFVLAK
jgi:rhodanese-related sulfurtransferase